MNLFLSFTSLLLVPFDIYALSDNKTTNNYAILTFLLFVISTLIITYFASKKTKNKDSFYAAGGKITGLQNGLAIAGDYMSAASFLGISGLVFFSGFDGLIYSIGFLVGWPIILFLLADKLKNCGCNINKIRSILHKNIILGRNPSYYFTLFDCTNGWCWWPNPNAFWIII